MAIVSTHRSLEKAAFLLLCFGILYAFWRVIEPYALVLVTAGIAAIVFTPLQKHLETFLGGHRRIAAIIMVFAVLLMIVIPLFFVLLLMAKQASEIVQLSLGEDGWLQSFDIASHPFFHALPFFIQEAILNTDFDALARNAAEWAVSHVGNLFSSTTRVIMNTVLFFISFYYLLVDRAKLHDELITLSPLRDKVDDKIMHQIVNTVRSVVFGALILALVQGSLAAVGMTIFGVPGAFIWGAVAAIASQVPLFGVGVVMIPAILYLAITGDSGAAIGLTIWSGVVVGLADNFLAPFLVKGSSHMHTLLVLISILGGIQLFGPIGFIVGPTILAAVLVILNLYKAGFLERA